MEAAFFDLDKTVIARASVAAFGRTLYNHGLISRRVLLRAVVAHLIFLELGADKERLDKIRRSVLAVTRGWERDRVESIVQEALTEVIEPIIYQEALELIEQHQNEGRKVVIVSATPEEIVRPLAEFLGADDAIATRSCVDAAGRYTGELEFYSYGPAKVEAITAWAKQHDVDLATCYAYSDSHTDVPMLEAVGHPVAVNPDKELMRVARANKWTITQFSHPMPMRNARAKNRLLLATGAASVLAAVTLLGLARGRYRHASGRGGSGNRGRRRSDQ